MRRDEALRILGDHRKQIASFCVKSLALFGSVARDEAGPNSDIDVLVEFDRVVGLFTFLEFQNYLEKTLGHPVDLVSRDAIKKQLREQILREAILAA